MRKVCRKCGERKWRREFYRHPTTADRRCNYCKDCMKAYDRARYADRRAMTLTLGGAR